MKKTFRTEVPLYDWASVSLVITDDLRREIEKSGGKYRFNQKGEAMCDSGGYKITLDSKRITRGVISHESGHIAWDILKQSGVKVTPRNDEPLAYLSDWLVDWIHSRLHSAGIRVKRKSEI